MRKRKRAATLLLEQVQTAVRNQNYQKICQSLECVKSDDDVLVPLLSLFIPSIQIDRQMVCPLLLALELQRVDLMGVLLQHGAPPERRSALALKKLLAAWQHLDPHLTVINQFPAALRCKPSVLIPHILYSRDEARDLPVLEAILAAKADVTDKWGARLTLAAAQANNAQMLGALMAAGASVSLKEVMPTLRNERAWLDPRKWGATLELIMSAGPWPTSNLSARGCKKLFMCMSGIYARSLAHLRRELRMLPSVLVSLTLDYFGKQWHVP